MIQFDGRGKGRPLPEPDGTINIRQRADELRFLKVVSSLNTQIVALEDGVFLMKAHVEKSER